MKTKRDVLKNFAKGIVVFNDESWVRLIEYQKLQEENKQFAKRICELQSDLVKAKNQI